MKLLAIESSGLVAGTALWQDGVLLAEMLTNNKKTHSETLLPMIDEIIRMTDTDKKSLDAIAVSSGPGSFTGLRIGAATAKGLGLALQIPLIAVPSLDAMAYQCYDAKGLICPMMDAKRDQVYTGLYRFSDAGEFEVVMKSCPMSVKDLLARINEKEEPVLFSGDGVPAFESVLKEGCTVPYREAPSFAARQRPGAVAELGALYAKKGCFIAAEDFVPEYLRPSQAERVREERKKEQEESPAKVDG